MNRPASDSREEYIFSVCAVGNLFTGRVAHSEHMLLHVQSVSSVELELKCKCKGRESVFVEAVVGVCVHACVSVILFGELSK